MSDHISGPRALADPIADITDVYAFPSPERPGHLVLVVNTLPFAQPSDGFSDALVYRFRLRPLRRGDAGDATPFRADATELVVDCVFAERGADGQQVGTCTLLDGRRRSTSSSATRAADRRTAYASSRACAGTRSSSTPRPRSRRSRPGSCSSPMRARSTWTARTSSASSSSSTASGCSATRIWSRSWPRRGRAGSLSVRIERVGRPEIKNLMLGPKQFDQVNRDLEIRDLYNMEDAFELGESYQGAYRARLNANLAFWDSLDGAVDWPVNGDGAHPLTELLLADYLVVDVTKPYVEQRLVPRARGGRAARRGARDLRRPDAQRRRHGPAVHAGRERRERADHPRWRRRVDPAVVAGLPLPGRAEPGPAEATTAPLALTRGPL